MYCIGDEAKAGSELDHTRHAVPVPSKSKATMVECGL
jgi:hypothetical protein